MPHDPLTTHLIGLLIGLIAGLVGGASGLGGSIIILPALALALGDRGDPNRYHTYMAAAMVVNAVVAVVAVIRHSRAHAVRWDVWRWLQPSMVLAVAASALLSNAFDGRSAKVALACFQFAFCVYVLYTAVRALPDAPADAPRRPRWAFAVIGAATGSISGLLAIGGGTVMVPLLIVAGRLPTRQAIATSASVMWMSSLAGAAVKVSSLELVGQRPIGALALAFWMSLGAVAGSWVGAGWTHRLSLPWLKLAIALIVAVAGARMVGLV